MPQPEPIWEAAASTVSITWTKSPTLGYWVRTSRLRQGIATRTTLLLARFGFEQVNLNRIEIVAALENRASQGVAKKVGATREGILRHRLLLHGHAHDAVLFSLIPQDGIISPGI